MPDYAAIAASALASLTKYGRSATLRRITEGTYNPATGATAAATTTDQTVTVAVLPASKGTVEAFDERFMSGTLVGKSLRSVLMGASGLTFDPAAGDKLILGSDTWHVIGATPLEPAGTAVLWRMGIQK